MQVVRQEFNGRGDIAPCGLDAYWYPNGRIDAHTQPRLAKVRRGIQGGSADLLLLPDSDGPIEMRASVWHASDQRRYDGIGNVSSGALRNGVWEFAPWSWDVVEKMRSEVEAKKTKERVKA